MESVPIFVNCRDRVEALRNLVMWAEARGCEEIYLLDNDSAYGPLLEYFEATPHTVVRLGANYGKFSLWDAPGAFELTGGRRFVYTDPDVVPVSECPDDVFDRLASLLARYPGVNKVGLGLKIDDLPAHYPHRQAVIDWERVYWQWPVEANAYYAPIDTTFALYRPGGRPMPLTAIRTGFPYVARHDPWYADPTAANSELRFYESRAAELRRSAWSAEELPPEMLGALDRRRDEARWSVAGVATRVKWRLRGPASLRRPPD
jgi:hypothetical protein